MFKLTTNDTEEQTPEIEQSLDELARQGARRMILAALELEVEQYVQALRHVRDDQGHAVVVRNGKSHHQRRPSVVSHVALCLHVLLDLQLQGCQDHPTSSLSGQLVQGLFDLGGLVRKCQWW